jgi:hypothetical protein
MNDELIKRLREERDRLYPGGWDSNRVVPRGCGKTKTVFIAYLRHEAYEQLFKLLEELPGITSYDEAQKWICEFVRYYLPEDYL